MKKMNDHEILNTPDIKICTHIDAALSLQYINYSTETCTNKQLEKIVIHDILEYSVN